MVDYTLVKEITLQMSFGRWFQPRVFQMLTILGSGNKALDVEGQDDDNGTPVIQFDFNGGRNQIWYF
jgi:hypothetical protein